MRRPIFAGCWITPAELKKEKERPKPPQWSPEHIEFQNLIQEATREAAGLATALSHVLERHRERLVAAARFADPVGILAGYGRGSGDSLLFNAFDSSINVVLSKIAEIQGVLEPGRPKMHVIRSEENGEEAQMTQANQRKQKRKSYRKQRNCWRYWNYRMGPRRPKNWRCALYSEDTTDTRQKVRRLADVAFVGIPGLRVRGIYKLCTNPRNSR